MTRIHRSHRLLAAACCLALLCVLGCDAIKAPPKQVDPTRTEVEAQLWSLIEAWNMRDVDAVLSHYDYDASVQFEKGAEPMAGDELVAFIPARIEQWNSKSAHCAELQIVGIRSGEEDVTAHVVFYCYSSERDFKYEKVIRFIPTGDGLKIREETFYGSQ